MKIEILDPQNSSMLEAWMEFISGAVMATGFHHPAWLSVLLESSSVTPCFMMAIDKQGKCRGVLPAYYTNSIFSEPHVTSLEGGMLATDRGAAHALHESAMDFCRKSGGDYLLLRNETPQLSHAPDIVREFAFPAIDLTQSRDTLWASLNQKTRWSTRKAEKNGYHVRRSQSGFDNIYPVYAQDMHRLGTPVPGRDFFQSIQRNLGNAVTIYEVLKEQEVVGGMLCLCTPGIWLNQFATVQAQHKNDCANYLLYWRAIEEAFASGAKTFGLGRSDIDSSWHRFKQKWRGRDDIIHYQYYFTGDAPAALKSDQLRSGRSLKQKIWSALPQPVCNKLGPLLRRPLPFG